jgi:hypothetical protein
LTLLDGLFDPGWEGRILLRSQRELVEYVHLEAMRGLLPLMVPVLLWSLLPWCRISGRRYPRRLKHSFFLIFCLLVSRSLVSRVMHSVSAGNNLINLIRQGYGLMF